ncbi:hypothetical protein QE152_g13504 [Popillia japonica]|uniref:Uncharacterized protein n=1 Tax=Popillia japonica TaxID=7064 RepID=A0AAW1L9I5_POPJA
MLISYVSSNHRAWDTVLAKLGCAVRTAKHEVTGLTPYFITFGREMVLAGDEHRSRLRTDEPLTVETADRMSKPGYNAHMRSPKDAMIFDGQLQSSYQINWYGEGILVWRRNFALSDASKYFSAKLADKFVGPFMIHRRLGRDNYELKDMSDRVLPGTWNSSHLKLQPSEDS